MPRRSRLSKAAANVALALGVKLAQAFLIVSKGSAQRVASIALARTTSHDVLVFGVAKSTARAASIWRIAFNRYARRSARSSFEMFNHLCCPVHHTSEPQ